MSLLLPDILSPALLTILWLTTSLIEGLWLIWADSRQPWSKLRTACIINAVSGVPLLFVEQRVLAVRGQLNLLLLGDVIVFLMLIWWSFGVAFVFEVFMLSSLEADLAERAIPLMFVGNLLSGIAVLSIWLVWALSTR
jgi:hypothetical protein